MEKTNHPTCNTCTYFEPSDKLHIDHDPYTTCMLLSAKAFSKDKYGNYAEPNKAKVIITAEFYCSDHFPSYRKIKNEE